MARSVNLMAKAKRAAADKAAKEMEAILSRLWLEHNIKVLFVEVDERLRVNFGWNDKC